MRAVAGIRISLVMAAFLATTVAPGAAKQPLAPLIDAVIRNAPDSQLPAHLSVMIGVTQVEQTTAVKQAVARDGAMVRTFNVRLANHDDVVMMVHDEQTRSTKAYLSSPAGTLRKALAYQDGAAAVVRSLTAARDDFAKEIAFWEALGRQQSLPR